MLRTNRKHGRAVRAGTSGWCEGDGRTVAPSVRLGDKGSAQTLTRTCPWWWTRSGGVSPIRRYGRALMVHVARRTGTGRV